MSRSPGNRHGAVAEHLSCSLILLGSHRCVLVEAWANGSVANDGLPWELLGAMPEMLQTAWGSLYKAFRLKEGETLLIRGRTASVGLAAAAIAKKRGARVKATTRYLSGLKRLQLGPCKVTQPRECMHPGAATLRKDWPIGRVVFLRLSKISSQSIRMRSPEVCVLNQRSVDGDGER
jgi:hypothetical protein